MDRAQKRELADSLHRVFDRAAAVVVTQRGALTVQEMTDLRRRVRDAGANFKVTKNRLTRIALQGTRFQPLAGIFKGPTAIAYADDPVAPAKAVVDYARQNDKIVVLGGAVGGNVLDANGVKALATLPSLDVLRGRIVGVLRAPATRLAMLAKAPAGQLARVIGAYGSKESAA